MSLNPPEVTSEKILDYGVSNCQESKKSQPSTDTVAVHTNNPLKTAINSEKQEIKQVKNQRAGAYGGIPEIATLFHDASTNRYMS